MKSKIGNFIPPLLTVFIGAILYSVWPEPAGMLQGQVTHVDVQRNVEQIEEPIKHEEFAPEESNLAKILDRPLFSETRRNPEIKNEQEPQEPDEAFVAIPEQETSEPVKVPPPDVEFLGIMKRGEKLSALLRSNGVDEWHQRGNIVMDWEITEIKNDAVTFVNAEEEITIKIRH
ncbi:hypothetical protein F9L33_14940 [Amylibacter sp. SFDW26]|uniref:hypothetical protein n=1 Tax=Amylibacter sp. SFDW26 TaxID=2652722 RepID=UPI001261B70E|nr:hypothetical protein [Amylibacter sp. SFDW26]KAB7610187.1 hypothetical protein F9L33_14940 [Amylibacter sp. SFDW26]